MDTSPYVIYSYSIRSHSTKETYFRRLRLFFDAVSINGSTFEDRCNLFVEKGKQDPNWAFNSVLKYRIKLIVYTMVSSGIRVGAWDYLKWGNVVPIKKDEYLVAAKMTVYAGEADEYFTFMSPEAFRALESWMESRKKSGESISSDSWLMRNLWNSLRPEENSISKKLARSPEKLNSIGIKR